MTENKVAHFTILVIEDNPATSKLIKKTLEGEGFVVIEAESGYRALEMMERIVPDLIIQDFILPDIDGIELNRKLRKASKNHDVPILGLSGFLSRMQEVAEGGGFTAFLIKPVEPSYLLEVVNTHLPISASVVGQESLGKHILIVDDDPSQSQLLGLNLKQAGFKITYAEDGKDAFQKALNQPPDAIISDILMPNMDGFQLCFKIRHHPDLSHIPVILISSHYLDNKDQDLAKKSGATGFVTRSSEFNHLLMMLEKVLSEGVKDVLDVPLRELKKHHTHTLIRQLKRQVLINSNLERRNALQSAQLTLLRGIAEALTANKENIDFVLQNILNNYLDAAGISKGIVYLKDTHDIWSLRQVVGFPEEEKKKLETFFGAQMLLTLALVKKKIIRVPSEDVPEKISNNLLKLSKIKTGLIIPLLSATECVGVLFLGSPVNNILDADPIDFAKTLGAQLGQAIALTMSFEKLGMSELRSRTLMDSASCGILVLDQSGIILEVNKKGEELFGNPKEEILNKNYKNFFVAKEDQIYASTELKELITQKKLPPKEGYIKDAKGAIRDIEYSAVCVEIGNENLLLFILNDVTERNSMRIQTLLSDKLATMGTLAAGIVHEINNPITWILSNLNFLKEHIKALQDGIDNLHTVTQRSNFNISVLQITNFMEELKNQFISFQEVINDSLQGGEQVQDIIHNLKGFARTDDETEKDLVDIHEILNTAIKIATPEFKYRAKLEKNFADNIPMLFSNKGKLHQVFLNLIMNAAQALSEDHERPNFLIISTQKTKNKVRVDITDTGSGISEENLTKIFEPFFTTKPLGIGTGLGLSICHQIIENLGGEIVVKSKLGEGSTFSVYLPVDKARISLPQEPKKEESFTPARILIVDDEPSLLKTLRRILETQHSVTGAGSGQAALELLSYDLDRFDIIITDLNMPDVSGIDIYRFLESKNRGLEHRLIFMTAGASTPDNQTFLSQIKNACIEKPFRREELLKLIEHVMSSVSASR